MTLGESTKGKAATTDHNSSWFTAHIRYMMRREITLILLLVSVGEVGSILAQSTTARNEIILQGEVTDIRAVTRASGTATRISVDASMSIVNAGKRPLLLLKNPTPACYGILLTKTAGPADEGNVFFRDYKGPSLSTSSEWASLRSALDQNDPPPDEVRSLEPGESWTIKTTIAFSLHTKPESDSFGHPPISWDSLHRASSVWMRLNCDVWPLNLEPTGNPSQRSFGQQLQERWSNVGFLQTEPLVSEPMPVRFATIEPTSE